MKRLILLIVSILPLLSFAEHAILLPQYRIDNYVPAGNYSGIVPLGNNAYAVVNDNAPYDGFYIWHIEQNERTGEILRIVADTLRHGNIVQSGQNCDYEGVAYFPDANTIFISDEATQGIYEHNLDGSRTGRVLNIPAEFSLDAINPNYGFEALTYSTYWQRFFTTTENTIKQDGEVASYANLVPARLRIQTFDNNLQPQEQFVYETDAPQASSNMSKYAFGVPELLVNEANGDLYILEREFAVTQIVASSVVYNKLYKLANDEGGLSAAVKEKIAEWKTKITLNDADFIANYEGMCWGRTLSDGSRTILLVNDSQDRFSIANQCLHEYIKVIVLYPSSGTGIEENYSTDLQILGKEVISEGKQIYVYNPIGKCLKIGQGRVSLEGLNKGVYLISNGEKYIKIVH